MGQTTDSKIAIACFALAGAIGLAGAFVGLDYKSFWVDELYTAGIVEPMGREGNLFTRIAGDLNSPLYFILVFLYSKIVGTSDAALRSFSALSGCVAVVLFIFGTKRSFSLPARLFGAAMATGSFYWFVQSQNARNYAFAVLVGTGILVLCLALLSEDRAGETSRSSRLAAGLLALSFVACFTHFYLVFESLSALFILFLIRPRHRHLMVLGALGVLVITALYVKLFVGRYSQIVMGNYWLQNSLHWYIFSLKTIGVYAFGKIGRLTIALCIATLVARGAGWRTVSWGKFPYEPETVLLAGVPILMVVAGLGSSLIIAPNFSARYLLICAPFLWGLCARLYDALQDDGARIVRVAANLVLSVAVLAMATIVIDRLRPSSEAMLWSEPFRASADWIRGVPECRGQIVPVVTTDSRSWYKPGYAEDIYTNAYARYLRGFARPILVFIEDVSSNRLPADIKAELQRRADGQGCPILAWGVHLVTGEDMAALRDSLAGFLDRPGLGRQAEIRAFRDGFEGFVLYLERGPKR